MKDIIREIETANKIIILTHVYPDMDAIGSQFGLKGLIKDNFPEKTVLTSGERNKYQIPYELDDLSDEEFKDALVISTDTGNVERISDQRFDKGYKLIKIDHHNLTQSYGDIEYVDTSKISTCSILTTMAMENRLRVSKETATYLFSGLITDSGRFLYNRVDSDTFKEAAFLAECGVDLDSTYKMLYVSTLRSKRLSGHVLTNFTVEDGVAYMKFPKSFTEKHEGGLTELKSGTINLMANLDEAPVWATFTEYQEKIFVELRGRIPVIDIAVKFGGGGHELACGTAVDSWEKVDMIINELKEKVNEHNNRQN